MEIITKDIADSASIRNNILGKYVDPRHSNWDKGKLGHKISKLKLRPNNPE